MAETNARRGRLQGKVVLITGAAQGIGFETAKLAVAEGADVVIADIQVDKGAEAADSIGATFVLLDVTHDETVKTGVDAVVEKFGRVDVLVNNAGVVLAKPAQETTVADFQKIIAIDLEGVFRVTNEVGRHMIQARSGSIVNLASTASYVAMLPERLYAYSTAKAGVAQMARTIAVEWAEFGIRANSVAPGRVRTPLLVNASTQEMLDDMASQSPQKRLIEPSEIAEGIVFLASDAASAINGATLPIDGGFLVH